MQYKKLSTFRITHYNGEEESVNSETMEQALKFALIPETESAIVSAVRTAYDINTLVDETPKSKILSVTVRGENDNGNIATPRSANVHTGDLITLQAVPARNYRLKAWMRGSEVISTDERFVYTVPDVEDEAIVISAEFELGMIDWTATVEPAEATADGCLAFPSTGRAEANTSLELIAVSKGSTYSFDHWERNGVNIGTNEILSVSVAPLSSDEMTASYRAVFKAN